VVLINDSQLDYSQHDNSRYIRKIPFCSSKIIEADDEVDSAD